MFSSRFLGIAPSQALAVSLLDRSVNVVMLCLFFSFASIYIKKKFKMKKGAGVTPEHVQPLTGRHKEQLTPQP
jgi:hypothetical protein